MDDDDDESLYTKCFDFIIPVKTWKERFVL